MTKPNRAVRLLERYVESEDRSVKYSSPYLYDGHAYPDSFGGGAHNVYSFPVDAAIRVVLDGVVTLELMGLCATVTLSSSEITRVDYKTLKAGDEHLVMLQNKGLKVLYCLIPEIRQIASDIKKRQQ